MDQLDSPDNRAMELLRRVLPETQCAQFTETGILEVSGCRGIYRICASDLTRILDAQTRRPINSACLQLSVTAPVHDRIIAEYLFIRNDEDLYWRTANIFPAGLDNLRFAVVLTALLDLMLLAIVLVQLGS